MNLDDAIKCGLNKSKQGRSRRKNNFYNSPAFPDKLIRLFNTKFQECCYGTPPPVSKQVRGMLNGFIKVCRGSNWQERKIYEVVEDLVTHWDDIKLHKQFTIKNHKRVALGDRPSLVEFLICRESILSSIESAKHSKVEVRSSEVKLIETEVTENRFTPTEAEMQADYEIQMEDMIDG